MNLINIENILISNFLFLYFYLTGGIITTRYIKGNSLIKNSLNIFFGITLFITFLSIVNFLSNFSINLSYLIILYSVGIIFLKKKFSTHIFFYFNNKIYYF